MLNIKFLNTKDKQIPLKKFKKINSKSYQLKKLKKQNNTKQKINNIIMQPYNMNNQEQVSNHTFDIKPTEPTHPIYMINASDEISHEDQQIKFSQSVQIKYMGGLLISKSLTIFLYFLLSNSQLLDFIFVTLLISIDFWLTKNIFGKQLSGLRWWIELNEYNDEQEWVFESADPNIQINSINDNCFWIINLVAAAFWLINLMILFIITSSLFWIGLGMFCFVITLINLACFYKCRGNHQQKLHQIIEKVGLRSATRLITKSDVNDESLSNAKFDIE